MNAVNSIIDGLEQLPLGSRVLVLEIMRAAMVNTGSADPMGIPAEGMPIGDEEIRKLRNLVTKTAPWMRPL